MNKYTIKFCAYKRSGKLYNSETHDIGVFDKYPASDIYNSVERLSEELDKSCGLNLGSIEANNFIVLYLVLDNTDDPLCMSAIVRA